ncbi:MAG: TonB-dependent receptor [Opitutae bacterium]|nr:TonB-dependent receptor [Opitutae bacterium]
MNSHIAALWKGLWRTLALSAVPALAVAQSAPASDKIEESVKLEKFTITGSRLAPPDFEGALPVTSYSAAEIAKDSTAQTINNFLRFNPTSFGGGNIDEGTVNGGNGTAVIGLRGLPTLTLVNGRRVTVPDTNQIPLSAIDRVEVLKDGNGAVYGADAVGGVINIITKHNFVGAQFDIGYQNTTRNDISSRRFEAVFGGTFGDRGNFTMGVAFFKQNDLFSKDRDELTNTSDRSFGATSSTPNPGKFNLSPAQALAMFGVVNSGTVSYRVKNSVRQASSPTDFRVGLYGNVPADQSDRFTFSIYTPTVRPAQRYNYWSSADYKLFKNSEAASFYTDLNYLYSVSHAGLAPSPAPFRSNSSDGNFTIKKNYYWNQQVFGVNATDITSWDYRFVDFGPRDDKTTFRNFAGTFGLKGDVTDRISYDVSYFWNRSEQLDEEQNGVNRARLLEILEGRNPTFVGPRSFNPFTNPFDSGVVSNDPEMLRYINFTPRTQRDSTTRVLNAIATFKPIDLAAGQIQAVAGWEERWEDFERIPDLQKENAAGSGWNSTTYQSTHFKIKSTFGEVVIPLLKDIPFAKSMQLGAAIRHETFSHFDKTPTILRFYVRDQINKELTARISYSEGFTIPTPGQLDPTVAQSFPNVFMPWLGVSDQANQGVLLAGNPALKPTTSKSYNLGIIWAPHQVKNFSLALDYYKIEQDDIIVQDPQLYIDAFARGGGVTAGSNGTFIKNNNAPYADRIIVDTDGSATGIPGYIVQVLDVRNENLAQLKLAALDINASYFYNIGAWGRLNWHLLLTRSFKYDIDKIPGALPTTHYAGYFSPNDGIGPGTVPKWKGNLTMAWDFRNFSTAVKYNYTGAFKEDPNGGSDFTSTVPAWPTIDAQVSYTYPKTKTTVRVGVTNAFNKMPPKAESAFQDKYDRSSHNILGAQYNVSISQRF